MHIKLNTQSCLGQLIAIMMMRLQGPHVTCAYNKHVQYVDMYRYVRYVDMRIGSHVST